MGKGRHVVIHDDNEIGNRMATDQSTIRTHNLGNSPICQSHSHSQNLRNGYYPPNAKVPSAFMIRLWIFCLQHIRGQAHKTSFSSIDLGFSFTWQPLEIAVKQQDLQHFDTSKCRWLELLGQCCQASVFILYTLQLVINLELNYICVRASSPDRLNYNKV